MLSHPRCIILDSRIHHRFASDVERTAAGIIMLGTDPHGGWGERARGPMEGGGGGGPTGVARSGVFRVLMVLVLVLVLVLMTWWVGCSARFRVSLPIS